MFQGEGKVLAEATVLSHPVLRAAGGGEQDHAPHSVRVPDGHGRSSGAPDTTTHGVYGVIAEVVDQSQRLGYISVPREALQATAGLP